MKFGRKRGVTIRRRVADYRLSASAEEDLLEIALYGFERFGPAQSEKYRDQLKCRFSLLAELPLLFPAVDHIRPGYRRSVCGAHSIYYRIESGTVEIVRILKHQDTSKAFP
jgi:toxin ParE1/3/4